MKQNIHPTNYTATVTCACGNTFATVSTKEAITTEICSNCHPFFTGKQKLVDTAHRVEKYEEKKKKQVEMSAGRKHTSKKAKQEARKSKKGELTKTVKADAKAALKAAKSALSS
ncbi:MAG: 50S ribosomal protein L31 [Candidatus Kerfeldbacteria bacterium]|nr:50S ribosomal protein L31 [Candidatus Kerfeldbacteria bacterium]